MATSIHRLDEQRKLKNETVEITAAHLLPWTQTVLLTSLIAVMERCTAGPDLQRHAQPAVTGYTTAALLIEKLEQISNCFVYMNKARSNRDRALLKTKSVTNTGELHIMKFHHITAKASALATLSVALLFAAGPASAHCDGVDGPVIKAAQQALDTGNVNRVLIWVQQADQAQIKDAFRKTIDVRKLNPSAREMADYYFFETLVRVHRAGEGAPYTGIKPAGRDLGPAVLAGDKALETGSVQPLANLLTQAVHKSVGGQFKDVIAKKDFKVDDVAAGQEYVKAYVGYIHSVERIYAATEAPAHGDTQEGAAAAHQH